MFHLFLATPEHLYFNDEINSLIAPGTVGYLEILTDHAPIITSLKEGRLDVRDKNNKRWTWAVSGGFLEVSKNQAVLLADALELSTEIDIKRAQIALKKSEKILESKDEDIDIERAKHASLRSKNRIKIFKNKEH